MSPIIEALTTGAVSQTKIVNNPIAIVIIPTLTNVGKYLNSEKRDVSNIMPSQILSLNQFAETVSRMSLMHNPTQGGFFSL